MPTNSNDDASAARDLLLDAFGRVGQQVRSLTGAISDGQLTYRPDDEANTVAWLLWHLSRVQDDHVADAAGTDQVWTSAGWAERFGLPFHPSATGFGHDADEVAAVRPSADLLAGYHHDVHEATVRYVEGLDTAELERIVDENWDPPVTVGVRLVSVIGDCMAHLGQAAYVRGLAERAGQ